MTTTQMRCPICGSHSGFEIDSMGSIICDNCGCLFVHAAMFGMQFITRDARDCHPHYSHLAVRAWNPELCTEWKYDIVPPPYDPNTLKDGDNVRGWTDVNGKRITVPTIGKSSIPKIETGKVTIHQSSSEEVDMIFGKRKSLIARIIGWFGV